MNKTKEVKFITRIDDQLQLKDDTVHTTAPIEL